ncbi:hypothetical protein WN944_010602 [Citrus x changshan-huyou]|uniref:Uncharacterized protein n=1 Tax=Citrus x changshan-huyou TaxID=2935761 RepID=A0AAP0MUF1_9ROSI
MEFPPQQSTDPQEGMDYIGRGRARRSIATTRERIPHRQGDRRRPSRGTSRPTERMTDFSQSFRPWFRRSFFFDSRTEHKKIKFDLYLIYIDISGPPSKGGLLHLPPKLRRKSPKPTIRGCSKVNVESKGSTAG